MFWRSLLPRYALKNFRQQMNIHDKVTLRGLLRRFGRKYPRTTHAFQISLLLSSVYILTMTLIPGSSLPFQKAIRVQILNATCVFSKLWFYNLFTPSGGDYLIKLNELILSGMNDQLFDADVLESFFKEIQWLVQVESKNLKHSNYFDLLLYSEIILQNIVRYQNRILLEPSLLSHYFWVYQTVLSQLSTAQATPKQDKHVRMFYAIVQYILNFGREDQTSACLNSYLSTLERAGKAGQHSFIAAIVRSGLREQQFLDTLKRKYRESSSSEFREKIIKIFQKLDEIHGQTK